MKVKLLSLFLFLFSLTACSPNNQNDKAVHFGIAQKPQNLDPRFASDAASEKMNNLIYSSLFYFDNNIAHRAGPKVNKERTALILQLYPSLNSIY